MTAGWNEAAAMPDELLSSNANEQTLDDVLAQYGVKYDDRTLEISAKYDS